jgi:glycosyltransferase involved in cell wall biosynthesis
MATLTVVTLTFNEERNIASCLEGVRWADQVLVVDSGSTDRTVDIAQGLASEVLQIEWKGYGQARNVALQKATCDWILWLDADERVTPELADEIRAVLREDDRSVAGYDLARRAYFLGKWIRHCGWYPGRIVRLFRRGTARFSETLVHEQLVLQGATRPLQHDLLHFTDSDLDQYFWKFNRYTTFAAQDLHAAGRRAGPADLLLRPPFMFLKMYLFKLGFLDGVHGFILCVVSSAYVFVKYAKLWDFSRSNR